MTFCEITINKDCIYQTYGSYLYLPEKEGDLEADTEKQVQKQRSFYLKGQLKKYQYGKWIALAWVFVSLGPVVVYKERRSS